MHNWSWNCLYGINMIGIQGSRVFLGTLVPLGLGVYVRCWGMGMGWIPRNLFRGICPPLRILPLDRTFHSSHIPVLFFAFHSIPLHWLPQFGDYLKLFDIFQSAHKCKEKCKSVVFVRWQSCHSSSSSTAHNFLESVLQSLPKVPCHAYPSIHPSISMHIHPVFVLLHNVYHTTVVRRCPLHKCASNGGGCGDLYKTG